MIQFHPIVFKEPLITLGYSRSRHQGALLQACVDLSRKCFAASVIGCNPPRTRPGTHRCYVVELANGITITCARRLAAARSKLAQSGHRLGQRLLRIFENPCLENSNDE